MKPKLLDLQNYTDGMLLDEVKRRGWEVTVDLRVESRTVIGRSYSFRRHLIEDCEKTINFTRNEERVISILLMNAPEVVEINDILNSMYSCENGPSHEQDIMRLCVMSIRRKLKGTPYEIKNQPRIGYYLTPAPPSG